MNMRSHLDKPWYRQPLVWLLIAIPFAGVVMSTVTATMAYRQADTQLTTETALPLSKTSWRERGAP